MNRNTIKIIYASSSIAFAQQTKASVCFMAAQVFCMFTSNMWNTCASQTHKKRTSIV